MPLGSRPEAGDVVVRQAMQEGSVVYVMRTVPGPDQFFLRTRQAAVERALAFAKRARVGAWFSNGEADIVRLEEVPSQKHGVHRLAHVAGSAVA